MEDNFIANRYFTQFMYSFFKKPVILAGKIPLSSSAAVGLVSIKGVLSVVKTGTGLYQITLDDKYSAMGCPLAVVSDSTQDIAVSIDSVNLSAKTMTLTTKVAGSAANVTDACDIYIQLFLSNSSVD